MLQIHPDQSSRLEQSKFKPSSVGYADIKALRSALNLELIPDEGLAHQTNYGLIYLFESEDLKLSFNALSAVTFGVDVLKLSPAEWLNIFDISDKEHIRRLMQLSSSISKELDQTLEIISEKCGRLNSKERLNLTERSLVVAALFYQYKFPIFFKRWKLTLSDVVLNCCAAIQHECNPIEEKLYQVIDLELIGLISHIQQKNAVKELEFETLADFERIYQ